MWRAKVPLAVFVLGVSAFAWRKVTIADKASSNMLIGKLTG